MVLVLIFCLAVVASGVQGAPLEAEDRPSTMPPMLFNLVEDQDYRTPEQKAIDALHAALNARKKGGSYGRKRRSPFEIKDFVNNKVTGVEVKNHGERGQADLDLQHAKPVQMKHGRRRRNPQEDQVAVESNISEQATVVAAAPECPLDMTPIQRVLCKAGAKPMKVEFNEGYGRRRRSPIDFIPFSVYDENRVNTLRIEQNDFMSLPLRQEEGTVQAKVTEVHLPSLVNANKNQSLKQ
jgi:hypothetical protein